MTVYDYQPYDQNAYSPFDGCDAASADVNKIYRCSYGDETEYQDLAFSGRPIWLEWNAAIASTPADKLPRGLTPSTKLFEDCGFMRISSDAVMSDYDKHCISELEKVGLKHHQHVLTDVEDMERLWGKEGNWRPKVAAFAAFTEGKRDGFMDTSAGLTYADKSCTWARYLCEKAGVKFVLGPLKGKFDQLVVDTSTGGKVVRGLKTADGKTHPADVVIAAAGGWTPSIVPEVSGALETTAGSVVTIQLPSHRKDLWDKVGI